MHRTVSSFPYNLGSPYLICILILDGICQYFSIILPEFQFHSTSISSRKNPKLLTWSKRDIDMCPHFMFYNYQAYKILPEGPGGSMIRQWDYQTNHTSLSPIRCGFGPGFVNYKKGALDSVASDSLPVAFPWSVVLSDFLYY